MLNGTKISLLKYATAYLAFKLYRSNRLLKLSQKSAYYQAMEDQYKEILLSRIMHDMKQTSTNMYYCDLLIDRQIFSGKLFNTIVSVFSVGGAACTLINTTIPIATGILVGCASIAKQLFPVFFMESTDIAKLCDLRSDYSAYFYRLQNVFGKLHTGSIAPKQAEETYNELTKEYLDKNVQLSRLFGKINKKMNAKASTKSDEYLKEIYNGNSNI